MSFFSHKNKTEEPGEAAYQAGALRTMQDDLEGKPLTDGSPLQVQTPAPTPSLPESVSVMTSAPRGEAPDNLPLSPFLAGEGAGGVPEASVTTNPVPTPPAYPDLPLPGADMSPLEEVEEPLKPQRNPHLLMWGVIVLLLLAVVGGGLYYFFFLKKPIPDLKQSIDTLTPEKLRESPPLPPEPEKMVPESRFTADKANILSINTETATAESLRAQILQTAAQVKAENLPGAVEFLVRDQNYNPLAFSRFAYLMKMNFPADLLSEMDDSFSLYIYLDQGQPHTGVAVKVKNEVSFQAAVGKAERQLPAAFVPLDIDTTTAPKTGLNFKNGSYGTFPTRYVNIDPKLLLSVDYAVAKGEWLVGTSQFTLRAVLDKEGKR